MKRLCFGTFIDILIQCKKETVTKSQLTAAIISTIDSDHKYDTSSNSSRALNHLYKCTGNFTYTYSNITELAPDKKKVSLVKCFAKDIIPLIDTDKYELAVLALRDIIKNDKTLDFKNNGKNVKKFNDYVNIYEVLTVNEYILSDFLVDIFRYTIIEIKNTDGKEWLESICQNSKYKKNYELFFREYVESFQDKRDTIHVWADARQKPKKKEQSTTHKDLPASPQIQNTPAKSQNSEFYNENNTQMDSQENDHNSSLFIPAKYQACLYCEYFSGIAKTIHKNTANTHGNCSLYKKTVSTYGTGCHDFNPNYTKISLASMTHGI